MKAKPFSDRTYGGAARVLVLAAVLLIGFEAGSVVAIADEISQLLDKSHAISNRLAKLTEADVPAKWRTSVKTNVNQDATLREYSRGENKVLQVRWKKEWIGSQSNRFTALIFDGKNRLGRIAWTPGGNTIIMQLEEAGSNYQVSTTIKPDGKVSVTVIGKSGFMEWVEVDGRNTHLVDDLEFAKTATLSAEMIEPFTEIADKLMGKEKPEQPADPQK